MARSRSSRHTVRFSVAATVAILSSAGLTALAGPAVADEATTVSVADATVVEGSDPSQPAELVFTVSLSEASSVPVSVAYSTSDGTAQTRRRPGFRDYESVRNVLTFAPGRLSKVVRVPIAGDNVDELDETISLNLTTPTNATIADSTATGTITDDDTAVLSISDATIDEPATSGNTVAVLNLTLSNPVDRGFGVAFTTADGTATAKLDYGPDSGSRGFSGRSLQTEKLIKVHIKADAIDEDEETILVNLTPLSATAEAPDLQAVITITNG